MRSQEADPVPKVQRAEDLLRRAPGVKLLQKLKGHHGLRQREKRGCLQSQHSQTGTDREAATDLRDVIWMEQEG